MTTKKTKLPLLRLVDMKDIRREPLKIHWIPPDIVRADIQGTISEDSSGHTVFHWTPEKISKVEVVWITSDKPLDKVSVQIYRDNIKLTMGWISCLEFHPNLSMMRLDLSVVKPRERLVFQFKNESGLKHYISIHLGRYEHD